MLSSNPLTFPPQTHFSLWLSMTLEVDKLQLGLDSRQIISLTTLIDAMKHHYSSLPKIAIVVLVLTIPLYHILAWWVDKHDIRDTPGPKLAALSDAWLGYQSVRGQRSTVVHDLHRKVGKFVRIAPNHVSISDPEALPIVYGHGSGTTKSDYYDSFVFIRRGIFSTRSRAEHTRKRKMIAHMFSPKNVSGFENHARMGLMKLIKQWDKLCEGGVKGISGTEGESGWVGRDGRVWFDVLPWCSYLSIDIVGDLAFGAPFGMLDAAKDLAPVAVNDGEPGAPLKIVYVPAIQILNSRGDFASSIGVLPLWIRPHIHRLPWYSQGQQAGKYLAGMAIARVEARLAEPNPTDRGDLLSKLMEGKSEDGSPMGKEELISEALTQLIAGSDTVSNSSAGIIFHLAQNPKVQKKLQAELDSALGLEEGVIQYESVKKLKYLEACINEGLRALSTVSMGLPRVVGEGGLDICGRHFKEGTIISVPSYTVHRNVNVWGDDIEEYRPERWFERDANLIQKTFNPFSVGPRACVGKNLAILELFIIIATLFRRYEFTLESDEPLKTREGFLRKPVSTRVGMKRRSV